MSNLVPYGNVSMEEWDDADKKIRQGKAEWFKPTPGNNPVRFLPPRPGEKGLLVYHQHFIEKADGSSVGFACPLWNAKQPCPVCEHSRRLSRSGNQADEKLAKRYQPRPRALANIIDRKDEDFGPKVYGFGQQVLKQLKTIADPEFGGNFFDPMTGFDINVRREGTGQFDTEYKLQAARANSPLSKDAEQVNAWIQGQPDLQPYAVVHTAEKILELCGLEAPRSATPEKARARISNAPAGSREAIDAEGEWKDAGDDKGNW